MKDLDEDFYDEEDYDSQVRDAMFKLPGGLDGPATTSDPRDESLDVDFVGDVVMGGDCQFHDETFY